MKALVALACVAASAAVLAQRASTATVNKQLLVDFFGFTGTRQERADRFLAPDYVQHNPRFLKMDLFTGAHGRQAWVAANEEAARRGNIRLVDLGGIALRDPIILIAEDDLVLAVYRGQLPEQDNPAQRHDAFAFEAFRIHDGQFTEHWDQVRLRPGWMETSARNTSNVTGEPARPAVNPIVPEPLAGCVASPETIAANKAVVIGFSRAKRRGLARELLIAECDFVAEVWKERTPDRDQPNRMWEAFTFDVFRIQNGRLTEQWDESTPSP